jgi:hypothetical protein
MKKLFIILATIGFTLLSNSSKASRTYYGTPYLTPGGCEYLLYCLPPYVNYCFMGNTAPGSIINVFGLGEWVVCSIINEDDPETSEYNEIVLEIQSY